MPATDELERRLREALHADALRVTPRPGAAPVGPGRRPARARRRRAGLVAVPALAATAAVVVVLAGPGSSPRAVAATPPMLVFDRSGAPPVSALLSDLQARASRLPSLTSSPGGSIYLQSESWDLVVAVSGGKADTTVVPKLREIWSDSSGPQLELERSAAPITPGRLSPAEESRARRGEAAGPVRRQSLSADAVRPYGTLAGLPRDDPQALFTRLVTVGSADRSDPVDVAHAMLGLRDYLTFSAPTPAFLTSLYGMLETIPGVSDAGWVTDRAGRAGVAIAVPCGGAGYMHSVRLIVDPRSGRLLSLEDIQLDPSGVRIPTPFVASYDVFLRQSSVPGVGTRPPAGANP